MALRFAELFAGAGGLSLGLERAGWTCAWHAEISEQPRAILTHRWPQVPLVGDVMTLDGQEMTRLHGPIDLLSGGSPCQDLSVAGKRAGMTEGSGTRSSLFYEQMRLWKETGADLCLWENVDGARSSNEGQDFGHVLRAFVGVAVPVPSDGWRSAGVAAGPLGVAAWRVLDAQFFGVPQRRRRIFVLGTRTGRVDPAEVLSLGESVRGDSQAGRETREGIADGVDEGAPLAFNGYQRTLSGVASPLMADDYKKVEIGVIAFGQKNSAAQGASTSTKCTPTLDKSKTPAVLCVTGEVSHALTHDGHDGSEDGTGRGTPIVCGTLRSTDGGPDVDLAMAGHVIAPTLSPGAHNCAPGLNGQDAHAHAMYAATGIPRRLTPRECERLMAWPDDHTLVPFNGKPLSDSARYKACGNGVASVHSHWIGWQLRLALENAASSVLNGETER